MEESASVWLPVRCFFQSGSGDVVLGERCDHVSDPRIVASPTFYSHHLVLMHMLVALLDEERSRRLTSNSLCLPQREPKANAPTLTRSTRINARPHTPHFLKLHPLHNLPPNMPAKMATVEIGEAKKGETKVRRSFCSPDKLVERSVEGVNTMSDVLEYAVKKFKNKPMVGYRDLIKMHKEEKEITKKVDGVDKKEKKTWEYFEMSDYKYITYQEFADKVLLISSGLVHLGLGNDTRFNIYASTAVNWQLMAHSCFAQGITFCTAYDTLGEEGLQHSLDEPEVVGVFTNADLLPMLGKVVKDCPHLKYVIYDGKDEKGALSKVEEVLKEREGRAIHIDELIKEGKANPAKKNPPKPEDTAAIMYTSGSTGKPKGVILKQSNIVAAIGAVLMLLGKELQPNETFLAYLPLAHILEFVVECALMSAGVTMGYGKVKTLTSNSTKNCLGDLQTFKPSILVGVPAVFELIRKGITSKVNAGGSLKKNIFNASLSIKKNKIPLLTSAVDAIVFKQVKAQTGGRLRLALSGGAPLSRETQEFLDTALVQLLQGYGMTESSA